MSKPLAVAIMRDSYSPTREIRIAIRKSRATGCTVGFHAPSWRPMAFRTLEGAKAKLERHHLFICWEA